MVKVKWSRYRPGVAQRVGRGIALHFNDRGTRRGWVVSNTRVKEKEGRKREKKEGKRKKKERKKGRRKEKERENGRWPLVKVKVKWSRYRPGVAQRVGRRIALLFNDRDTRSGWVVSSAFRPQFTPGKTRYPLYRRLGGPQGRSGRTENLVPTRGVYNGPMK